MLMDEVVGADTLDGVRVLVVDDDATVCRETAAGLARGGLTVVTALNGDRAIEQALATPPDVAVVDLYMPVSGVAVIRALKDAYRDSIHVIAFTGMDTDEVRKASLEAGCDDFVVKPLSIVDLRMRIAIAARRQRAFVEARLARETLERQQAYASEANALLAHDLRNAMMTCLTTLSLVVDSGELDSELTDLVRGSVSSLRLASVLVANLLDVGRFEDAAVKPQVKLVDIRALLESVVSVHAASSAKTCGWELDCDPTLTARFDPGLVERVLHNLAGNARRYAGEAGLVRVAARRWFEVPPDSIEIAVENSGPPVEPDVVGKLFSKYGRGADGKRGLGLYFCRLACEAHGGSVEYETIDGRPVFFVRLPGTP
jgi:signal transduction histidine kinase